MSTYLKKRDVHVPSEGHAVFVFSSRSLLPSSLFTQLIYTLNHKLQAVNEATKAISQRSDAFLE